MTVEVVGRVEELSSLRTLLDRRAGAQGPIAVALEGEAGIGKSTLWREGVEAARERGLRVLTTRPAESERELAHAGLGDLFDGVVGDVLPGLTPPQRRALEVALFLEEADQPVDPLALGVAVRSVLQRLSEDDLLVAIDDLQWLDASTAGALAFALRRLPEATLLLLWTRRLGESNRPAGIEDALGSDRVERVRVGPLSLGAIHQIVHTRLHRSVARPTLLRLHEVSAGNPFYALELARALGGERSPGNPTEPLPVPARLEELVLARLERFSGSTRDALVLASAQARLTVPQLGAAGIEESALEPALGEQVIERVDGTVRFTHPLLASVLYQGLSARERQGAHLRLAQLVDDPVARARHLALSTGAPDADLAAALEQAAVAAGDQGAPLAAAELGEHALRLTPPESAADRDRRASAAARAHRAAGGIERGRTLAADLLSRTPAGAGRAGALALMAEMESEEPRRAIPLLKEALLEHGVPTRLQASIHQRLSLLVRFTAGLAAAEEHARAAVELADQLGEEALRAAALAGLAIIRFNAGQPGALQLAEEAYALAVDVPGSEALPEADFALAHVLVWSSATERARALLEGVYRTWSERDERVAAYALWYLALAELRAGRLSVAAEIAEQARELNLTYARDEAESPQSHAPLALVAAQRGELERARELTEQMCRLVDVHRARLAMPTAMLGVLDLWGGDAQAAVQHFAAAEGIENAADTGHPGMCWWRAEQVEALLEAGRIDDAVDRLDAWEADARRLGDAWALAHATRCRGLVAAAGGGVEQAVATLGEAVSQHEQAGDPFGHARALLALGTVQRRARQKRAAREAIELARAGFEKLGAAAWAERAQQELGSIGGRTRAEGLTPAERRVAGLVAEGRTNAEVAAALFLAERTVASHLTRVYAKLGVRSRTQLARKLR